MRCIVCEALAAVRERLAECTSEHLIYNYRLRIAALVGLHEKNGCCKEWGKEGCC